MKFNCSLHEINFINKLSPDFLEIILQETSKNFTNPQIVENYGNLWITRMYFFMALFAMKYYHNPEQNFVGYTSYGLMLNDTLGASSYYALLNFPDDIYQKRYEELNEIVAEIYNRKARHLVVYDDLHTETVLPKIEYTKNGSLPLTIPELNNLLKEEKRKLDVFKEKHPKNRKIIEDVYTKLDMGKNLKTIGVGDGRNKVTNAFLKCYEMCLFLEKTYDVLFNKPSFTYFCNAEFPGGFVFAIDHYLKSRTNLNKNDINWFANSLWPGNANGTILNDKFGLYKDYPEHWLMDGKNYDGNVLNPIMKQHISNTLKGKVDLYTSDIGIPLNKEEINEQEKVEANLNIAQIIDGLNTLKKGGVMICKTFLFFTPFNMSLYTLLKTCFDIVSIYKPRNSRPTNSEIYIIGTNYNTLVGEKVSVYLSHVLEHWNMYKYSMDSDELITVSDIEYTEYVTALYDIYGTQLFLMKENMLIAEGRLNFDIIYRKRYHVFAMWEERYFNSSLVPNYKGGEIWGRGDPALKEIKMNKRVEDRYTNEDEDYVNTIIDKTKPPVLPPTFRPPTFRPPTFRPPTKYYQK